MGTSTNTTNFNLDKLDRDEQELGDSVTKLRTIQNGNMDIIDAALTTISNANIGYVSVSANYTALATDHFIEPSAAITITVAATPATGFSYLVARTNTVSILGSGCTVNGFSTATPVSRNATRFPTEDADVNGVLTVLKTGATTWRLY